MSGHVRRLRGSLESPWRTRVGILAILLVGLIVRLGAVGYLGVPDIANSSESGLIAERLVTGKGYTFDLYGYRDPEPLRSYRPPLYTLFLAFCYAVSETPSLMVGVLQAFLSTLACLFIYLTTARLATRTVALLATAANAAYPVYIVMSTRPLSLTVHAFLLAALIWLSLRLYRRAKLLDAALVGVVLGLSVLGRATVLGFLPGLVGWLWLNRERISPWRRVSFVVVLFTILTLVPWTVRNYYVHHQLVPISTDGGLAFWTGNNPFTTGTGWDVYTDKVEAYTGDHVVPLEGTDDSAGIMVPKSYPLPRRLESEVHRLSEVELDRKLYLSGLRFISDNPRQWLELTKTKFLSFWWFRTNIGNFQTFYRAEWLLPYQIVYGGLLFLFLTAVVLSFREWRAYALLYWLFIYFTLIYTAFSPVTRYRWEVEQFMLMFAVMAVVRFIRWGTQKRSFASGSLGYRQ